MTPIRFSNTHGQNVQLENYGRSAFWQLKKHSGVCFTDRSLAKGEILKFKLKGSGHALLGLLSAKPDPTAIENIDATTIEPKSHWTHFRFKRETTTISLNHVKTREVSFTRDTGEGTETKAIQLQNKNLYVFFEIQFGDITIDIENDEIKNALVKFDETCGANITLKNQQSQAFLSHVNVSAICCTDRPLAKGEIIDLSVAPINDASWTYIKLFISNRNTKDLALDKTETSLGRYNSALFPQEGIRVDKNGSVQLRLTDYGEIAYSMRTEERKVDITGQCVDLSARLFLYVELFRVRVELESTLPQQQDDVRIRNQDRPIADTSDQYLSPIHKSEAREHEYEKIAFHEIPGGERDTPVSTEQPAGYVEMSPPGKERPSCDDEETQLKCVSGDDSITHVKKLNVEEPQVDPLLRPEKVHPVLVTESPDAGASGPVQTPPVPPRQRASVGPEYMNSLSPSTEMPQNTPAQVQITGLAVPSMESPFGTSAEEVVPFPERIRMNYTKLLDRLEPVPVADYLFQEKKMSDSEHISFLEKGHRDQCRQILGILICRPSAESVFKVALQTSAQGDILSLLKL